MSLKIAGFDCPCEGRTFPPDHYTSGSCTRMPMPLAAIRSILLSDSSDDFHADGRITVTRLLTCPREIAILDNCPVVVDIRKLDSRRKGTVLHEDLRRHAAGGYAEIEFPVPGTSAPLLLGEPISGRVDVVSADFSEIADYKSHSENSQRGKGKPGRGPDNDTAQLNIIRILIARGILGVDPTTYRPRMTVWHTAQTSRNGPPAWLSVEQEYMSEEDIGAFRPGGGDFTVAQVLAAYRQFRADRAADVPLDEALKRIPLMGRNMFSSTKCTNYCTAEAYCDKLEGISDSTWKW